jgi:hypothetical protein
VRERPRSETYSAAVIVWVELSTIGGNCQVEGMIVLGHVMGDIARRPARPSPWKPLRN